VVSWYVLSEDGIVMPIVPLMSYILFVHTVGTLNESTEGRVSLLPIFGTKQVSPKLQTPAGQPI